MIVLELFSSLPEPLLHEYTLVRLYNYVKLYTPYIPITTDLVEVCYVGSECRKTAGILWVSMGMKMTSEGKNRQLLHVTTHSNLHYGDKRKECIGNM